MQDLQTIAEPGRLQVQLAQAAALAQFVADEQGLPIKTAADGLKFGVNCQGGQLGQFQPGLADQPCQAIHQGVDPPGAGNGWILTGWGSGTQGEMAASRMQILPRI